MKVGKQEFLKLLHSLGGEWVVSSTPFGCVPGYSKIYLRRKRGRSGGIICSECLPNEEAEKIKNQIRERLTQ